MTDTLVSDALWVGLSLCALLQSGKDIAEIARRSTIKLGHPKEEDLALHLCKFPEAVEVRSQPLFTRIAFWFAYWYCLE